LPPTTDMQRPLGHVGFVPTTDSRAAANASLLDHLVGGGQQCRRKFQSKRSCCFSIEHQLEFGLLVEGNVSRFCTFQYLIRHIREATPYVPKINTIRQETTGIDKFPERINGGQTIFGGEINNQLTVRDMLASVRYNQTINPILRYRLERPFIRGAV